MNTFLCGKSWNTFCSKPPVSACVVGITSTFKGRICNLNPSYAGSFSSNINAGTWRQREAKGWRLSVCQSPVSAFPSQSQRLGQVRETDRTLLPVTFSLQPSQLHHNYPRVHRGSQFTAYSVHGTLAHSLWLWYLLLSQCVTSQVKTDSCTHVYLLSSHIAFRTGTSRCPIVVYLLAATKPFMFPHNFSNYGKGLQLFWALCACKHVCFSV